MGEQEAGIVGRGERDDKGAEGVFWKLCIMFNNFSVMIESQVIFNMWIHFTYKIEPFKYVQLIVHQ